MLGLLRLNVVLCYFQKLHTCLTLIKLDNEVRLELGLPVLSYDDLCAIRDLPALESKKSQHVMEQLGIFFAKSTDRVPMTSSSSSLHKASASAVASKVLKAQRNWFQDKRSVSLFKNKKILLEVTQLYSPMLFIF